MFFYSKFIFPIYKIKYRKKKFLRIQIGCSTKHIPNFINIDGIRVKPDLLLDIRAGLPFNNKSVEYIVANHVLEHFYPDELCFVLTECYRVLNDKGIFRIVVPCLENSVKAYVKKDFHYYSDFPRAYSTIGGKFVNYMFCDAQHKMAFDFEFMKELLAKAGFFKIEKSDFGVSTMEEKTYVFIKSLENHCKYNSLFIEASK